MGKELTKPNSKMERTTRVVHKTLNLWCTNNIYYNSKLSPSRQSKLILSSPPKLSSIQLLSRQFHLKPSCSLSQQATVIPTAQKYTHLKRNPKYSYVKERDVSEFRKILLEETAVLWSGSDSSCNATEDDLLKYNVDW